MRECAAAFCSKSFGFVGVPREHMVCVLDGSASPVHQHNRGERTQHEGRAKVIIQARR